jgi:unsaturated rhamnogalacturonyl hydrolase
MELIERYIEGLVRDSRPERPVWNQEKLRDGQGGSWNYIDGCMVKAILELFYAGNDRKYLEFADRFVGHYVREDGSILTFDPDELNLDNINEGKVLFDLHALTGREKYRKAQDTIYRQVQAQPRTAGGNFWHKKIYPNQVWLDGLYMVLPFYQEYDTRYRAAAGYADVFAQIANVEARMRDPATGLYRHAYDESRESFWCDKATGLSANVWLRAMGWFVMALVDVLEKTDPAAAAGRERPVVRTLRAAVDALLAYQAPDGMWYQVVDQGGRTGNYLEASGSAILAYAILKAVRLGYLPASYRAAGAKAFAGTCARYLRSKDGRLSLGGICLVAGLGGKDKRDGSYEYYLSEPVVEDEAKGVAPLLLAYTETLRI